MNTIKEIEQIDKVINQLKLLKKSLLKVEKLSDKAYNTSPSTHTPSQVNKASTALNWECMNLDKQRRRTWISIKEANELEVSLEVRDYNPSSFHHYK